MVHSERLCFSHLSTFIFALSNSSSRIYKALFKNWSPILTKLYFYYSSKSVHNVPIRKLRVWSVEWKRSKVTLYLGPNCEPHFEIFISSNVEPFDHLARSDALIDEEEAHRRPLSNTDQKNLKFFSKSYVDHDKFGQCNFKGFSICPSFLG